MGTRFLRFLALTLGLLIFSGVVATQTHREKRDPCKDTSNMTQGQMNEYFAKTKSPFGINNIKKGM
ncbi:MAG TPA: hypothetical protein VIX91_13155 [Candidatus Acidoferrum sp.]